MAKKKTSRSTKSAAEDLVDEQSTQDVSETSKEPSTADDGTEQENNAKSDKSETTSEMAETETDTSDEVENAASETGDESVTVEEPAPSEHSINPTSASQETESSFLPMALGGVAAGAIGFAAAFFGLAQKPDTEAAALSQQIQRIETSVGEQSETMSALTQKVDDLGAPDMSLVEGRLDDVQASVADLLTRLESTEATLNGIDTRLTTLEKRPVTEGASQEAVAAYERELEAAAADIARQRQELETLIANAIDTEDAAEEASKAAIRRASISRVLSALESGAPFEGALADLQDAGAEVPEALTAIAATGATPVTDLQQSFPDAARAALAIARSTDGASDESGGFTSFLRTQLGARSLEPREGNDPDAILSRAEAATQEGRLSDALSEIDTLPDNAKAEFSAWSEQATERLNALRAAQDLNETLN